MTNLFFLLIILDNILMDIFYQEDICWDTSFFLPHQYNSLNKYAPIIIYKIQRIILLIKALPKDIAALDKRSVLANVNSQGSGT